MQRAIFQLSLITVFSLISACGSESLDTLEQQATNTAPVSTVVQLQSAPLFNDNGEYIVAAERKVELQAQTVNLGNSLPYPKRNGFDLKSLHTDHWPDRQELVDANTSGIAVNLVWENWQPTLETNCAGSQIQYDGQCFTVEIAFDHLIEFWSQQGKPVTAILYGVPSWARDNSICTADTDATARFCAARNPNDYARFVGMIANRYNGLNGHGRISDFVIHNEVNMNQWYKVGCGSGIACDQEKWITDYTANFNAAYDRIVAVQPAARVMIPFAHHFDTAFDDASGSNPIISVKTFLRGFHAQAGGRKWRIAYHPYHKRLDSAVSSFNDLPRVTFGNIGVLAGWLRQQFPLQPESWEIHLTENGVSSNGQSDEFSQNVAVCNSYRNVLGTPGIENYIYHRMQDNNYEAIRGAAFGLRREDGSPKPVWDTWANMSGRWGQLTNLDCGFENLPYTKLTSSTNASGDYRASTRVVGDEYGNVNQWFLLREYEQNTYMAYECAAGASSYVSTDMFCGGQLSFGPVGYVHEYNADNRVALFSCTNGSQIYSSDEYGCGNDDVVEFIGYVKKNK